MDRIAVLVVDDEESVRTFLSELLGSAGYQVRCAGSGAQALEMLAGGSFDAVLLDVVMPEMSGLEVLRRYRGQGGNAPVVVLSGLTGADDAVRAMKMGASDYLSKPLGNDELQDALARALGTRVPDRQVVPPPLAPRPAVDTAAESRVLISSSPSMRRARALVERIANENVPVLLLGESGTGKEVIAREIHARSQRRGRPFIKVNCAALPGELLESELFGHERGAFTGATAEKPGKFELADQGTIFLDEIGEMAIRLQAKLLQVLQDEEFFRVGGKKSVRVDSRVVVATNRDLEKEIALGNFREDLYYRLNVVAIRLPPLRERREDVVPLTDHFLKKYGRQYITGVSELPTEVLQAFADYDWPGNVRELENMVRRLCVLKDPTLVLDELNAAGRSPASAPSLPTAFGGDDSGYGHRAVEEHPRGHQGSSVQVLEMPSRSVSPTTAAAHSQAHASAVMEPMNSVIPAPRYVNPFDVPQPPPPPPPAGELSLKDIGKRAAMLAEREAILAMLQRTAWNKRRAAGKLRISYKALLYKIKECGIIDPRASAEL
ncbi:MULTISPECIES: sigma-54 dependent transcriptional regulator [Myxococcus]|uniref:Sigma-54-dependent Fis family transcriptional regulator n=1 Tax=Myxococcus llanfairpwllgwyngyllgogerychwyrndrobwllllantysiliogogogochensis TaxID=2590453 RepID=A0A540WVE0_9BACT|nr:MULTISPECIES: sigma-54 dependent transcriptional regulator [Myxococcus]NTX07978.1 sigma-54-dependent Fis family transcriptional regulator [Myxococcus sp. CA040A]NTX14793.1 sigma-54-dependent Fis family transcriptional regulator [Myxococcus sp. CA056]NTX55080.1 sigma-54-dependent Fis family transcriptional regulator [Myxococcus sp. CA039A]TQF12972.1 sigma-54-dependent Fis family transcriptional regulator [Myxococcus llanfairpwllgwyngyllgogerychwyrndrobwllllantysiliogogogochensis]